MHEEQKAILQIVKQLIFEIGQPGTPSANISEHANLFDECGIDSTSILDLILGLEMKTGVEFGEEDLNMDVLSTVGSLAQLVYTLKNQQRSTANA